MMKVDDYSKNRGGWSVPLVISCAKCNDLIGNYQKDGGFLLRRMYVDRLENTYFEWQENKMIPCRKCLKPRVLCLYYKKENRPCFVPFAYTIKARPQKFLDYLKIVWNEFFSK